MKIPKKKWGSRSNFEISSHSSWGGPNPGNEIVSSAAKVQFGPTMPPSFCHRGLKSDGLDCIPATSEKTIGRPKFHFATCTPKQKKGRNAGNHGESPFVLLDLCSEYREIPLSKFSSKNRSTFVEDNPGDDYLQLWLGLWSTALFPIGRTLCEEYWCDEAKGGRASNSFVGEFCFKAQLSFEIFGFIARWAESTRRCLTSVARVRDSTFQTVHPYFGIIPLA